jgi:mannose-6-phosphate isomerase-like protein (cupin superfamily)
MKKEGKIWGNNILLFNNSNIQINQIFIKKGGRCSKHMHKHKNNIFFVQSGRLLIEEWKANGLIDSTILNNEQSTEIRSETYHRFTALEETTAIEIYYHNIEEDDIFREDTGTILS